MPTIKDVARHAGFGIATVSRVINNKGGVSKKTKEKILASIQALQYTPNEIARNMTRQQSSIVAIVIPFSQHLFFAEMIFHIESHLAAHNMRLMVCNSGSDVDKEKELIGMLNRNQVDGIIFITSNDIEHEIDPRLPVISFDRRFKGIPCVSSDNYAGGILAAQTLLEAGAQRLLYIGDDAQGELTTIKTEVSKRRLGFVDYLKSVGFSDYAIIEYPQGDIFIPREYIQTTLESYLDYDGIFAISDELAHFVVKTLKGFGKKVPSDIKVIGYDGIENPFLDIEPLTSIAQPIDQIAESLVKKVLARINKEDVSDEMYPIYLKSGITI